MWWCQFNLVHIFLWKLWYKPVSIYIVTAYLKKPLLYLANTMSVREIYRRSLHCWNFSLGNSPKAKSMQISECGLPGSKNLDLCYQSAQSLLLQQQLLGIPAREAIFESLLFNNPCMVLESPNKENISNVVPSDIPFSALNALLNLILDAVLQGDWSSFTKMLQTFQKETNSVSLSENADIFSTVRLHQNSSSIRQLGILSMDSFSCGNWSSISTGPVITIFTKLVHRFPFQQVYHPM